MGLGLSYSEAGALAGVSKQAIGNAIKDRKLKALSDKTLSREAVLKWASERRAPRGGKKRQVDSAPTVSKPPKLSAGIVDSVSSQNAKDVLALLDAYGVFADRADAERWRDTYVARMKQIEYEKESGKLVAGDDVRAAISGACLKVRTKLLALPSEQAPALHRLKTVGEVEALMREIITAALEELVVDIRKAD